MLRFDQFDMITLNIFYVVLIQMINWLNKKTKTSIDWIKKKIISRKLRFICIGIKILCGFEWVALSSWKYIQGRFTDILSILDFSPGLFSDPVWNRFGR